MGLRGGAGALRCWQRGSTAGFLTLVSPGDLRGSPRDHVLNSQGILTHHDTEPTTLWQRQNDTGKKKKTKKKNAISEPHSHSRPDCTTSACTLPFLISAALPSRSKRTSPILSPRVAADPVGSDGRVGAPSDDGDDVVDVRGLGGGDDTAGVVLEKQKERTKTRKG